MIISHEVTGDLTKDGLTKDEHVVKQNISRNFVLMVGIEGLPALPAACD